MERMIYFFFFNCPRESLRISLKIPLTAKLFLCLLHWYFRNIFFLSSVSFLLMISPSLYCQRSGLSFCQPFGHKDFLVVCFIRPWTGQEIPRVELVAWRLRSLSVGARCIFRGFLEAVLDFHLGLERYNIWNWKAKYSIFTVVLSSAGQLLKLEMWLRCTMCWRKSKRGKIIRRLECLSYNNRLERVVVVQPGEGMAPGRP